MSEVQEIRMKKSLKKDTHTGDQPIRVLKHNLTTRLVKRNEEYIKSLLSDHKLNEAIKYHVKDAPLADNQLPFIDRNGIINLHESYLSYVWIVCYYFFVVHEEGVVKPEQLKRGIPIEKEQNVQLLKDAEELFQYAKLLIRVYDLWDKETLPNPEYFDEETEEGWYIMRTNDLFVEVMNFILYHETAHAELQHLEKIAKNKLVKEQYKPLEIEADTRAIELILSNCRNRNHSEISIIIGLASILFFKSNLKGGDKHPDVNQRLDNAISLINPKDDSSIWTMLGLFMITWNKQFSLGIKEKKSYDNYKELYYDLVTQVT